MKELDEEEISALEEALTVIRLIKSISDLGYEIEKNEYIPVNIRKHTDDFQWYSFPSLFYTYMGSTLGEEGMIFDRNESDNGMTKLIIDSEQIHYVADNKIDISEAIEVIARHIAYEFCMSTEECLRDIHFTGRILTINMPECPCDIMSFMDGYVEFLEELNRTIRSFKDESSR